MVKKIDSVSTSLKKAYILLQASSTDELARNFIKEDQRLLKEQSWDYKNSELVLNKVKEIVESVIDDDLIINDKEIEDDLKTILWFWYHHAIGYAIWGNKDKIKALQFSSKALKYQTDDNPNQITQLLYLLVRDKVTEARALLEKISDEPDKTASRGILQEYLAGNFFK